MRLEVNGQRFGGFVAANAALRLDALSNTFGFTLAAEGTVRPPARLGDAVRVIVDEEPVLEGFVEILNVDGDAETHTLDIQGRDKTADLLDSSIGPLDDLRPPITLAALCRAVIAHLGASIEVVDQLRPPPFNAAEDLAAPENGIGAFEFLEKLARKRQAFLTSDAAGRLVITRASGTEIAASLIHRVGGSANNVLAFSAAFDSSGRFNRYIQQAQLNPVTLGTALGSTPVDRMVHQKGEVSDSEIRRGRQLVLVSESMSSGAEAASRAVWERNIRRARGRTYGATVHGYRNQTGELWTPNTIVEVVDELAAIDARLLINTVEFSLSPDEGRTTTLGLVERDAYTLELEEPRDEKVGGAKGGDDGLSAIFGGGGDSSSGSTVDLSAIFGGVFVNESQRRHFLRLGEIARPERDSGSTFPIHQVSYLGRTADAAAHYPFGMHANPGPGAMGLLFSISGNGEARIVMPSSPEGRPSLEEGEVAWFHPATGTLLHFQADGTLRIEAAGDVAVEAAGDVTLEAAGSATVTAPTIRTLSASTQLQNAAGTDDLHGILEEFLRFIDSSNHGDGAFQSAATAYADRVDALR